MQNTTLLFLIKKTDNKITDICLAMKKRGFGMGRWNGVGGKLNEGETIVDAVIRETKEEIDVTPKNISKIAELTFIFDGKPDWDQVVHTYFCEEWEGEPVESEEMAPQWYKVADVPFDKMWPDDKFWLPKALEGEKIKASFTFGENDTILNQDVECVASESFDHA
jgi:mutator protein MutT